MKLSKTISTLFEDTLANLVAESGSVVYVKYCDVVEEDEVLQVSQSIEDLLIQQAVNKRVVRKVFHSVVESFQNIRKHGLKSADGSTYGAFILVGEQTRFVMHFISAIPAKYYEEFINSINFVNGLDKKELKSHYMEVLDKGKLSEKGGAGLGLITIALKASDGIQIVQKTHSDKAMIIRLSYDIYL